MLIAFASFAAFASPAFSGPATPKTDALPGVKDETYSIVKPMPEPDDLPTTAPGTFKIGDTDVKISGEITVDIGVGNVKPPRR